MSRPSQTKVSHRYLAANTPLIHRLGTLRPALARAAQGVYDDWDQGGSDNEYGGGGICDNVAQALAVVVNGALPDVTITDGGQDGDDHAFIVVLTDNEAVAVDIPPGVYEIGGGYNWTKRQGVHIRSTDVVFDTLRRSDFDD